MSTPETAPPEDADAEQQSEIARGFLQLSAAYLFSGAYRDSLRAAFARHAVAGSHPPGKSRRTRKARASALHACGGDTPRRGCHQTVTRRS
jgi:hypothetical protein